jgi:tricorn protease
VFASEDDLWTVPAAGGVARRLTSGLADATRPSLSPDGVWLSFVGHEEGHPEIYLMPAGGGPAQRETYLGSGQCITAGWTPDGQILFASNAGQPFRSMLFIYTLDTDGGTPQRLNIGPARKISFGERRGIVIGRNTGSPATWKRYRGGTAGQIWIDENGDGNFRPLIELEGNLASPMWLGERIYFLSDHEGIGNLYSCLPGGDDLRRHSDHEDYYARNASSDGRRIVYHAGADLYLFHPSDKEPANIQVEYHSPQTQRNRKFVSAARYLDSWKLHPQGHSMAITSRGKAFTFANWEGAVIQHGRDDGPRYRLLDWLNDAERLIAVTDAGGEESFVILSAESNAEIRNFEDLDVGRPVELAVNPVKDAIAFSNHRYEICVLDLESAALKIVDRGRSSRISGFSWSPDGEWLAYSVSISLQVSVLKLWQASTNETFSLTQPVLRDIRPAFDPLGNYLYFLSYRHFDPVMDNMQFDLNFPQGVRPYLITLRKDLASPFVPRPRAPGDEPEGSGKSNGEKSHPESRDGASASKMDNVEHPKKPLEIDLEGIEDRIVAFPVEEGRYGRILGSKDGKALFLLYPVEGTLEQDRRPADPPAKGRIMLYDFDKLKAKTILRGVSGFDLSRNGATLVYRAGNRLRVLKAAAEADEEASNRPSRESGWIGLGRVKVSIAPGAEWRQMFREAWRLQRDHFWTPDMSDVDWLAVYERYLPLVDRANSRSEFSDLIWEMQGELGTSHSYESGGDYRPPPRYDQGHLGVDYEYVAESDTWRITHIVKGDAWDEMKSSPLYGPGINVDVGDHLLAINGRTLGRSVSPAAALVNLAGEDVTLSIASEGSDEVRTVTVKALPSETPARYREWVENNRRYVHEASDGRAGYLHIPDMGSHGYAEFHRGYLSEVDYEGLIVDVRFNGGGFVSQLLIEKLARKRLGYDVSRWGELPLPYPEESVRGPLVAITNEYAGSDGDIFSHAFKLMGLGPLIGMRTWGGVIGINPRHLLVDGTVTTQPEFSFWFEDVGWAVENYGTDPDIEVDDKPQDYARGVDAQLDRAISEIRILLAANPAKLPSFENRPSLALPKLPARHH